MGEPVGGSGYHGGLVFVADRTTHPTVLADEQPEPPSRVCS